jgi:flagellar basal body-associated protein FliL
MPSFIYSQRRNVDRLLALILLWNVVAGVFVTLGAPWLAEIAGATNLRSPDALPAGFGWLAFGVPTQFAGIWLSVLGAYALYRARCRLPWHLPAALFYAAQTFAITSPLHVDMWVGLFAANSLQSAIAINWIAIALSLAHAALGVERKPLGALELAREFWGATPLSRTALSRRYATIATIAAIALLPLAPPDVFYSTQHAMPWRLLLLLPMTFVAAYVVAFVWSGGQREPCFSAGRGVTASLLAYVYLAMAADLLSRWLSDGQEPLFRLFLLAWIFLLPLILIVPVTGALAGAWLGRKVAAPQESDERRSSRLTSGMWLTLAIPLLALLLSYALGASQRYRIESARVVARRALAHFDRNESEQLYAMFTTDSLAMIDRDSFLATLRERRDSLGELRNSDARRELRYQWYPRAEVIQFDFRRAGAKSQSSESIVIDVHDSAPTLSAVFMTFDGQPPAHNVFVPRRHCGGNNELLHCGRFDDQPPRSLF